MQTNIGKQAANNKSYYEAYEERYRAAYAAGVDVWGHTAEDEILAATLTNWVTDNDLRGKRVLEFACGEGGSGVILAQLGCEYHGVDLAPSALEKAREKLAPYPNARVSQLDMVNEPLDEIYDAALDVMGLHMLVTDGDRAAYLQNAFRCLKPGAPMLFFRESYRRNLESIPIASYEDWLMHTGDDYTTPQLRQVQQNGMDLQVNIPLLPARGMSERGYRREMETAGFAVEDFVEMEIDVQIAYAASIFARKSSSAAR